mmetsp:Transcript_3342/g.3855  ORF Transcript_3342/g.3855 Transcript_3342/m.3855 type:complete len:440 (+) Transcript_3342:122-1441(+)
MLVKGFYIITNMVKFNHFHLSASIILLFFFTCGITMFTLSSIVYPVESENIVDDNIKISTTTKEINGKGIKQRPICHTSRDILTLNETLLEIAQQQANEFHNLGGNLKAYEDFLNDNIDQTYERLGVTFIPDGKDKPLQDDESIKDYIIKAKRMDDHGRGGYGNGNLYGKFQNLKEDISPKRKEGRIDVLEPNTGWQRWGVGMGPIADNICKEYMDTAKITSKGNERKLLCASPQLNMKQKERQDEVTSDEKDGDDPSACHILSIGSNGQWGFEEAIVDRSSCHTHTFDCTIGNNPKKPPNDNIHFYPFCISHQDKVENDRKYLTFSSMLEKANMRNAPVIFKIDVEGFEYDVLTQMLKEASESGKQHLLPKQISIELHYGTRMIDLPWIMRWRKTGEIALFSAMMYNVGGYLPVRIEPQGDCDPCMEVLYIRVFCDED